MSSKTYKAIRVLKYGEPVQIQTLDLPNPSKNQLLVKIHFVPINPSDKLTLAETYNVHPLTPFTPGIEGSGTIVEVGPDCNVQHKVGDRVAMLGFGTWAEYALINSEDAIRVPAENTLEEAASSWVNPATAVLMIKDEVIKGGHKAVIHSAGASALGKMLIKELKEAGVKSINLVRREEYIQELKNLGADYVLNIKDKDFEEKLKKIANDESATICFEAVAGELTGKIFKAMPPGSHLVMYGLLETGNIQISVMALLAKKVLRPFWLGWSLRDKSPEEKQELGDKIQKKLKTTLKTEVAKVYGFEEVQEALEYYGKNASKGKVLLKF